jgi:hypothetical protein
MLVKRTVRNALLATLAGTAFMTGGYFINEAIVAREQQMLKKELMLIFYEAQTRPYEMRSNEKPFGEAPYLSRDTPLPSYEK